MWKNTLNGVFYSLLFAINPLLIFLFTSNNNINFIILLSFFFVFWESFASFIFISLIIGLNHTNDYLKQKNKEKLSLFYILIFPLVFINIFGIYLSFKKIIFETRKKIYLLIIIVSFFAGPFSSALLMISNVIFQNDGTLSTVVMNLSPIPTAIFSKWLFKEHFNKLGWFAIFLTMFFVVGMIITYVIDKQYYSNKNEMIGIGLITTVAILYSFDALVGTYFMHCHTEIIKYEYYFSIKVFFSGLITFLIVLPIVSICTGYSFYRGWLMFEIFQKPINENDKYHFGNLAYIIFIYGLLDAIGSIIYYNTIEKIGATFTTIFMLFTLIFTPIAQILGNKFLINYNISPVSWYYWLFTSLILFSILLLILHNEITKWFLKNNTNSS